MSQTFFRDGRWVTKEGLKKMQEVVETVEHIVSEEDLENNPELAEEGVVAGDVVELGELAELTEEELKEIKKTEAKAKKEAKKIKEESK